MTHNRVYQVEGIYGLTGSGKTTYAMWRAVEEAMKHGTHVYTNIGYDDRALKRVLWRRFGWKMIGRPRLHKLFHRIADEDMHRFWDVIPANCLVILDEVHIWFPQEKQRKGEDAGLVRYLSQHRKLEHNVWFISQFNTMVSHSFRKIQHIEWSVQNVRHKPINFGFFRFKLKGDGFFYCGRFRDEDGQIVDSRIVLPSLPWNRWIWQLFESRELHGGLKRDLDRERCESMVIRYKDTPMRKGIQWLMNQKLGLIACALALFALVKTPPSGSSQSSSQSRYQQGGSSSASASTGFSPDDVLRVSAVGSESAWINGFGRVQPGSAVGPGVVTGVGDGQVTFVVRGVPQHVRVGGVLQFIRPDSPGLEGGSGGSGARVVDGAGGLGESSDNPA